MKDQLLSAWQELENNLGTTQDRPSNIVFATTTITTSIHSSINSTEMKNLSSETRATVRFEKRN
jgi:hypothetical protein